MVTIAEEVVKQHKFRTLILLRRALIEEKYELCPALIRAAKRLRSSSVEIRGVLKSPLIHPENLDMEGTLLMTSGGDLQLS